MRIRFSYCQSTGKSWLVNPKTGVYFTCYLTDGTSYPAMTSVSNNPTVNGKETTIESYLIGFEGDLYG